MNIGNKAISLIFGSLITIVVTAVGYATQDETVARICFWQSNLLTWLIQPGPIIGYSSDGSPQFEGNPIWLALIFGGMASGILIYSLLVYVVITIWTWRKRN